jgi:sulfite exporter TauE/SafE
MNAFDPVHLSLGAALVAGMAGSGHCLAMCGGIAGALAVRAQATAATPGALGSRLSLALAYNVARIVSYAVAGGVAGLLGHALLRTLDVAPLALALRVLAGLVMVAAAGRLLFGWRLLDPLEAAGAALWRKTMPWASPRGARRGGLRGAVALGLAWGWLPCGLTYSMLLLAATTANVTTGALVMAAFGLGTLPAMVSATVAFERAARLLAAKATLRTVAGTLLFAFGAWTAGNAAYHALAHPGHAAHAVPEQSGDPHAGHVMTPGASMGGDDGGTTTGTTTPASGAEVPAGGETAADPP